jgi:hypothetical protein
MIEIIDSDDSPAERVENLPLVLQAMRRGVREALARHKQAGNPVAVWRRGRLEWISSADIPIEAGIAHTGGELIHGPT